MRKCVLWHIRTTKAQISYRCLDSIISLDSIAEISRLLLVSVAAQAGLCQAWSETPEDTFSHDEAYINYMVLSIISVFLTVLKHYLTKQVLKSEL